MRIVDIILALLVTVAYGGLVLGAFFMLISSCQNRHGGDDDGPQQGL